MIISYLTHKKIEIKNGCMTVIATKSPVAFRDIVQGFKDQTDSLLCLNEENNKIEIKECFDFIGDPLLSEDISKRYLPKIIDHYIKNLDEENRNKILEKFVQLENLVQDSLLLNDIPLTLSANQDIKRFLKLEEIRIDQFFLLNPYDIIETVLKIHQECNLKTIPVICNATNYLEKDQLRQLNNLVKQTDQNLILIEFTDKDFKVVPENVRFYYIDEDLVDWY